MWQDVVACGEASTPHRLLVNLVPSLPSDPVTVAFSGRTCGVKAPVKTPSREFNRKARSHANDVTPSHGRPPRCLAIFPLTAVMVLIIPQLCHTINSKLGSHTAGAFPTTKKQTCGLNFKSAAKDRARKQRCKAHDYDDRNENATRDPTINTATSLGGEGPTPLCLPMCA